MAEEVQTVNPDLIARDRDGKPFTVRYDAVNAMLLNEFLKEHCKVEQLTKDFESHLVEQQKQIEALTAGLQKVSNQLELSKPAPQIVVNKQRSGLALRTSQLSIQLAVGLPGAAYAPSRELWQLWRRWRLWYGRRRRTYRSLTRRRFGCRGLARARDQHHGERRKYRSKNYQFFHSVSCLFRKKIVLRSIHSY